ncbi:MAG: alpha/beta hydrolase [Candidatus Magasanikbacteria bacterium]|jgi:pimeloyl-ACP methyl ester carboxylesterase|nr:alpha/beta hydrolase [Candidatus Magasanikbacteria bacterium]MBT4071806.1 alpha/beta hydrolase [Candidatus Magasanikbacteria bacterium]
MKKLPIQLIILPGWGGSHKTWGKFIEKAGQSFADVLVIDLPCFGNEPCPSDVWGVEEYAEFARKKIETLEKKHPRIILGHSFGGQVATVMIGKDSTICDKLVLSGAAVFRIKRPVKKIIFGTLAKVGKVCMKLPILNTLEPLAKKILYKAAQSPDYSKTSGVQRDIFRKVLATDVSDFLPNIDNKTLVLWGEKDGYVPLKYGKKINEALPNSSLVIIPNGTHGLHRTSINEMIKQLSLFLS